MRPSLDSASRRASGRLPKVQGDGLEQAKAEGMSTKVPLQSGLTAAEVVVYEALEKADYQVLRHGWPDFLAIGDHGIFGIEVKSESDAVSKRQEKMHTALRQAGIPIVVVKVEKVGYHSKLVAAMEELGTLTTWQERFNSIKQMLEEGRDDLEKKRLQLEGSLALWEELRLQLGEILEIETGSSTSWRWLQDCKVMQAKSEKLRQEIKQELKLEALKAEA